MTFSLSKHEHKPLQVNPIKHSQPMGATLAFLGVKGCLPLMHAAQGCASYTKVFFTRHFNEPIAVYNTSVSDITAVLDGGDYSILMAIENIQNKDKTLKPSMIGLHTTGLTETKGDDVRGVGGHIEIPYVFVNTPDYEGGLESGWALTVTAMIEQLTQSATKTDTDRLVLLPHVSMQPIEVEKIKLLCEAFGFETYALPDLSCSLDGYWEQSQGKLANGGITVEQIGDLASCATVLSIGASMKKAAAALQKKNPAIEHIHLEHLMGLDGCDNFVAALMKIRHTPPTPLLKRWRSRLQDAMLDSHFLIGSSHFVVTGEPDMLRGICALLRSVGGTVDAAVSTTFSEALHGIEAENVFVGDLEDARHFFEGADMIISNFHAERILHSYENKALVIRGFPNYEELGNQLKNDQLYEGSTYFLFEIANALRKVKHEH
jgi:nitrogenase molybdenum-iron protein NifN